VEVCTWHPSSIILRFFGFLVVKFGWVGLAQLSPEPVAAWSVMRFPVYRGADAVGREEGDLRERESWKLVLSLAEDVIAQVRAPIFPIPEGWPVRRAGHIVDCFQ